MQPSRVFPFKGGDTKKKKNFLSGYYHNFSRLLSVTRVRHDEFDSIDELGGFFFALLGLKVLHFGLITNG